MGTAMDYLHWRGDLSFSKDPFNDIDALILSMLSYLPYKDIVPGIGSNKGISLKDTSAQYFTKIQSTETKPSNINPTASASLDSELLDLLKKAATCARFKDIQLSRFEENTDFIVGRQFAAITFILPNAKHEKVVAFRGTDNSLVGWKEDFELAYMEQIPAQESACRYLDRTIGILSSKFTVCGHSKGGNLAVYAGSHLNALRQSRLSKIINFDGPGFDFDVVPRASFSQCEHKVFNYVPEESIVGMLLEPVGKRTVLSSSAHNINQHNALNWRVERTKFMQGNLSNITKLLERTLKSWLPAISLPERQLFTEALFDILGASEGTAINPRENIKEINIIRKKYAKLDDKTKTLLTEVFSSLTAQTKNTLSTTIKEKLPKLF